MKHFNGDKISSVKKTIILISAIIFICVTVTGVIYGFFWAIGKFQNYRLSSQSISVLAGWHQTRTLSTVLSPKQQEDLLTQIKALEREQNGFRYHIFFSRYENGDSRRVDVYRLAQHELEETDSDAVLLVETDTKKLCFLVAPKYGISADTMETIGKETAKTFDETPSSEAYYQGCLTSLTLLEQTLKEKQE